MQGEWILVAKSENKYFVYKEWFGSCPGCDAYHSFFEYKENFTLERAQLFAKEYFPFLESNTEEFLYFIKERQLQKILPASIKDKYSDINYDVAIREITGNILLEETLPVILDDVLHTQNAELKHKLLVAFGYEKFLEASDYKVIDAHGEDQLIKIEPNIFFAYVKDASTPRKYLLRVPPNMRNIQEALAWTFNMRPDEYRPIIET